MSCTRIIKPIRPIFGGIAFELSRVIFFCKFANRGSSEEKSAICSVMKLTHVSEQVLTEVWIKIHRHLCCSVSNNEWATIIRFMEIR